MFIGHDSYGGDITYLWGQITLDECIDFCLSDADCLAFNNS
jgi:hypothetical protein